MKRGWKIFWIVLAGMTGLGIILCTVALVLGLNFTEIREAYPNGIGWVRGTANDYYADEEISEKDTDSSAKSYSGIRKLTMKVGGFAVRIQESDDENIYVDDSRLYLDDTDMQLSVTNSGDELSILLEKNGKLWSSEKWSQDYGTLYVYIPSYIGLEQADLSMGASDIYIEALNANVLNMNIGAADCEIDSLKAQECSLNVGAGDIELTGDIGSKLTLKVGAGEADLHLSGKTDDYNYDIKSGFGQIAIGGMEFGGVANSKKIENSAAKDIDLECGAGDVAISFEED